MAWPPIPCFKTLYLYIYLKPIVSIYTIVRFNAQANYNALNYLRTKYKINNYYNSLFIQIIVHTTTGFSHASSRCHSDGIKWLFVCRKKKYFWQRFIPQEQKKKRCSPKIENTAEIKKIFSMDNTLTSRLAALLVVHDHDFKHLCACSREKVRKGWI